MYIFANYGTRAQEHNDSKIKQVGFSYRLVQRLFYNWFQQFIMEKVIPNISWENIEQSPSVAIVSLRL